MASAVLLSSLQSTGALASIAVGLTFLSLAVLSFERREVTVGAWPWQPLHGQREGYRRRAA